MCLVYEGNLSAKPIISVLRKNIIKNKTSGDKSKPLMYGIILLIGLNKGSVIPKRKLCTVYTKLLYLLTMPKLSKIFKITYDNNKKL